MNYTLEKVNDKANFLGLLLICYGYAKLLDLPIAKL
jgi:hypothetical protein